MSGWGELPSQSTYSRFFGKFSQKRNTEGFPQLQHWFFDQVWNVYNSRADCENRIKELKSDFGLENFCLQDVWATQASFPSIMVSYSLMSLFRHFALNDHNRATLKTLKSYCFALGAWTINYANKKVLKISLPAKRRHG